MMKVSEQVVVVTGASSGLGEAVAQDLSAAGAKLVLTARRGDRLTQLAASLPGETAILPADIAAPDTAERLRDLALSRFGRVSAIVNNAGALALGTVEEADITELAQTIRTNFEAVVRASYVFGRVFKAQGGGAIINVTSSAAFSPRPSMGVYAGAKAAVHVFTAALRLELSPLGIKVGEIAPSGVDTPMRDELFSKLNAPPSKTPARPAAFAEAVRFMLEQPHDANIAGLQFYSNTSPS